MFGVVVRLIKDFFFPIAIILNCFIFSQSTIMTNKLAHPLNKIFYELGSFSPYLKKISESSNKNFNLTFNVDMIRNSGHSNIDNNGSLFVPGTSTHFTSFRIEYKNKYLFLELEPYFIDYNNLYPKKPIFGSYQYLNNHNSSQDGKNENGLLNSQIILHYKGFGLGYGYLNHWWSPGFHSSIALSSNAPSQETYSIGTFKDIYLGNFSFSSKIIVMPYNSINNYQLYFSGLRANATYHSNPSITLGFNRTYLSGGLTKNSGFNLIDSNLNWGIIDAAKLVIEPLFGSSKKGLPYTQVGTPGFDPWDELLSGYIKIYFPEDNLELYVEVASDDNRGNLNDLRAHWDHTLGYMFGFKRLFKGYKINIITGVEYLSTIESNSFNPKFYRGSPNISNFYSKEMYDFFTFSSRLMGAHSGSSSDDLIFLIGFANDNNFFTINYNIERHGVKSMYPPELKTELSFNYKKTIKNNSILISYEYENIQNYAFTTNNRSISRFIWIGYSFLLK